MEDGATGVKLENAVVNVSNSSNEIVTSRPRDQVENLVQDLEQEKVYISMMLLW